jgi:hypothetical protein
MVQSDTQQWWPIVEISQHLPSIDTPGLQFLSKPPETIRQSHLLPAANDRLINIDDSYDDETIVDEVDVPSS